jgi:predicted O-linked N-acetylglucosamine transferase (SPINDLY family)
MTPPQAFALAQAHLQEGRPAEAAALLHSLLTALPEHPEVLHLLGVAAYQTRRMDDALHFFRRAVAADPNAAGSRSNLGCTLIELNRYEEAVAELTHALRAKPFDADMHSNLGDAHFHLGRLTEAAAACRTALSLQPGLATAHNNLGNALRGLGQSDAALAAYRTALRCQPRYVDAQSNLGAILTDRFDYEGAVEALRLALEWEAGSASAHNNLACALGHLGRGHEAIPCHRRAIELCPSDPLLHSNLIYNLQFLADLDPSVIVAEQAEWNRRHAQPFAASIAPHTNNRDPERRLRVGYVSPDFREHPVAFFLAGLFAAHDRTRIETHCYASVSRPDEVTTLLRQRADVWHDVLALSHAALAEKIRADGIDLLVDLSMHSAENRLPVFARKPAPVQLSWLAYPGATGVETIDYRLTDPTLEPPVETASSTFERPLHLPDAWCCYEPIGPFPEITELPAARHGYPTFGSFSKTTRLSDAVLRCWAQIAAALPDARWLLLHPEGAGRERVQSFFGENAARLEFVEHRSWVDYLRLFARIDLCLDTFPHNGLTATCHALWMGTPVVTLAGPTPTTRAGASILTAAGLPEFIAPSPTEYATLAITLATAPTRLAHYRTTLRDRMRHSPLMDAPRFARTLETAYRTTWREWCERTDGQAQ